MKTYHLKVALRGISPMIWRRLRVDGKTSLANLHHIIQIAMGWEDDHLHLFHIYGKDYGIAYTGGIGFEDDPDTVFLDDFEFDVGDRFMYTYNFYEEHIHDIRIEKIASKHSSIVPRCISGNGLTNPPRYTEMDMICRIFRILEKRPKDPKSLDDIRFTIEKMRLLRFQPRVINHQLLDRFSPQS